MRNVFKKVVLVGVLGICLSFTSANGSKLFPENFMNNSVFDDPGSLVLARSAKFNCSYREGKIKQTFYIPTTKGVVPLVQDISNQLK